MTIENDPSTWRKRLHIIVFTTDTPAGLVFDVALIISILASVLVVMLSSVSSLAARYSGVFLGLEWFFTLLYTAEYGLRLWISPKPWRYARSFFGLVDLLSVLPTWLMWLFPSGQFFLLLRLLRVLRLFRVLKLAQYLDEMGVILRSLRASRRKITVFVFSVLVLVILFGSSMYLIEGEEGGFTSIPVSIYWAVVTLTTVGYGDISPKTPLGQALSSVVMLLGYAIIAVPTGIVTVELSREAKRGRRVCEQCGCESHDKDARYCKRCGEALGLDSEM